MCDLRWTSRRLLLPKDVIRFRAGRDVLPEWALAYFHYCHYFGLFAAISRQTTSVAHLTAVRFAAMPMPVPTIHEQEQFLRHYKRFPQSIQDLTRQRDSLREVTFTLIGALV